MGNSRTERNRGRFDRYREHRLHCSTGKVGWRDRRDARTEMRKLAGLNRSSGDEHPMNTYWCEEDGGHWHVGHRPASRAYPNLNDPRLRFVD